MSDFRACLGFRCSKKVEEHWHTDSFDTVCSEFVVTLVWIIISVV